MSIYTKPNLYGCEQWLGVVGQLGGGRGGLNLAPGCELSFSEKAWL